MSVGITMTSPSEAAAPANSRMLSIARSAAMVTPAPTCSIPPCRSICCRSVTPFRKATFGKSRICLVTHSPTSVAPAISVASGFA